jgi:hypothetical protein
MLKCDFWSVNKVKKKNSKNRCRLLVHLTSFILLFLFPLFSAFSVFPQADQPRDDNQFRGEVEVAVPIYKDLYLTLGGDLRLGQFAKNRFVRVETGFLYKQKIGKYFTVVPRYRYRAQQLLSGASTTENRLSADAIVNFKIRKFEITDNNLFEFRFRRSGNSQRYRNRLKISHPLTVGKTNIDLFVSDEVYYEWKERAWTRNRFKIGGSVPKVMLRQFYSFASIFYCNKPKSI